MTGPTGASGSPVAPPPVGPGTPPAYGGLRYGTPGPAYGTPGPAYGTPGPSAGHGREGDEVDPYGIPAPHGYPPLPERGSGQGHVLVVRLFGLGLALVLVGLGSLTVVSQFFRRTSDETTTVTGLVQQVVARTDVGNVSVHEGGPGEPLVIRHVLTWSFDRPTTEVTQRDSRVEIVGHCPTTGFSLGHCSVDIDVTLPRETSVVITSRTGDVTASGVGGTLEATTSTGDVDLRDLHSQRVTATSSTGDVAVTLLAAPRSVRAGTSTGDVRVSVPADGTAYQVTALTSIGDRTVHVPTDPVSSRTINASTSVGDLVVTTEH